MAEQPDDLITIQDLIRWGASRFGTAKLCYGHGTDNAIDEAVMLVLGALHLEPNLPDSYRTCRLTPQERARLAELIERRITEHVPVAYLTGRAWFAGLELAVGPQVLIPRSPIAELVEVGFEPWIDADRVLRVLDLCAGSGCIGIAAAAYLPEAEVDLADVSPAALALARENVARHGLTDRVRVLESDLFAALGGERYDVIVSNPPYVPAGDLAELPPEYRHEPRIGLDGGLDGLDLALRILAGASAHLSDGGILVLEVGSVAPELEQRLPGCAFTWIDFERGGEGVLLLTRDQLAACSDILSDETRRRGIDGHAVGSV